jgi:hypothetical protein
MMKALLRLVTLSLALLFPILVPATVLPSAPAEVLAATPGGTTLLAFSSSGDQPTANAAAVFQTGPDKDGVRHRTLVVFEKKDGKFVPAFSNDRLIACSMCSQQHDDAFLTSGLKATSGHVHIEQVDIGKYEVETNIELDRRAGAWHVGSATRKTYIMEEDRMIAMQKLPLPASGLAKDMDAKWTVPVFLNTILINNKKNGRFSFLHGDTSMAEMWKNEEGHCDPQDCTVLVQQQDGCISLVRDESSRPFGSGSPDPDDEKLAIAKAINICKATGGKACKEVRTDCYRGDRFLGNW